MMYRIFNGLHNEAVPRSVTDSVFGILADSAAAQRAALRNSQRKNGAAPHHSVH